MPTAPKLNQKERRRFFETLAAATDERAVQEAYEAGFKILFPGAVFIYPCKCDGYLDWDMFLRLLCEYKLDERLNDPPQRAKVLVQVLFYLKLFEENGIELPSVLFVGDRNECFLLHSNAVLPFLDTPDVDWSLPPSSAWQKLPSLLARMTQDCAPNVFVYPVAEGRFELADVVAKLQDLAGNIVRHVRATPANVQRMYDYFCERVLPNAKLSPNDSVGCFFAAILNDTDIYLHPKEPSTLVWRGTSIRINRAGWDAYFAHYDNHYTPRECAAFTAIYDRLLEDEKRRRGGEFYTPTPFVNQAHLMIAEALGDPAWRDHYTVWDCAWGTGNLTRDFPFANLYASTNELAELRLGEAYNPNATKFLFDFLNDPIDGLFQNLPQNLVAALEADKPFLFFINPPYATANNLKHGTHKAGCAITAVNAEMKADGMGAAAQQLFAQFLYRILQIKERFHLTHCHLALFCNPIWLSGAQHRLLRKRFLESFSYDRGILFNAGYFADVAANWGIHFTIWKPGTAAETHTFLHTLIEMDEGRLVPKGRKAIYNLDGEQTGSDWCKEPVARLKAQDAPQLSSACKWKQQGVGRLVPGALGYYVNASNAVYNNATCVCLLSGTSSKGHGISVLPENFLRVTANFTARRLIPQDWANAKDEYGVPDVAHPGYPGFEADSVLFALFETASQQSSLGHVDYAGREWDIPNAWFWLARAEAEEAADAAGLMETWQSAHIAPDPYVATLLPALAPRMSDEGREVLRLARKIALASYAHRAEMNILHPELQLLRWDAGWYQIKPLAQTYLPEDYAAFRAAFRALATRLTPLVHTLGFLR